MDPIRIDEGRCGRLRWKGLFYESVPDPTVPRSNTNLAVMALAERFVRL